MRSTSHELSIQFGYLSSVCALFNLQPRPKRSVVIHFVPTVFVSKWPIIYATISLSCDFHFLFHPLKSQYIALPCKYFFSYLNNSGTASLEENFYEIIVVHVFFFFSVLFFYCGDLQFLSSIHGWFRYLYVFAMSASTAFLTSPKKTHRWFSILIPIWSILRIVLKVNSNYMSHLWLQIQMPPFLLLQLSLIYDHRCWCPCVLFECSSTFLPVCTAVCTETKFTTFTSLYLRQRLVRLYVVDLGCVEFINKSKSEWTLFV